MLHALMEAFMDTHCGWLIRVPTFHPEPDFPSDLWREVPCCAPMHFDPPNGERCEAGHVFGNMEQRYAPFGEEWNREREEEGMPF
jgi:hypothetical protein